jgi:succinate dehydrogenase hydrophobic anchor subunit
MVTPNENVSTAGLLYDATPERIPTERIGLWAWLGIYVTGVCLSFFLGAHLWLIHYASQNEITFKSSVAALQSPLVMVVEVGLLVFAVVHGMMGIRRVILDLEFLGRRGDRYLTWALTAVGIFLIISGTIIFYDFSSGIAVMLSSTLAHTIP